MMHHDHLFIIAIADVLVPSNHQRTVYIEHLKLTATQVKHLNRTSNCVLTDGMMIHRLPHKRLEPFQNRIFQGCDYSVLCQSAQAVALLNG